MLGQAGAMPVLAEIRLDDRYALVIEIDDGDPRRSIRQTARGPAGGDAETIEDPGFTAALLAAMGVEGTVERATVLRGEQTNTSIVAALVGGAELVVKL